MTVQQVAEHLQLSTMMVYKLAQEGQMPAAKIGRVWRFEEEAIDRWLKQKTVEPSELPFKKVAQEAIEDFVREVKKKYGEKLSQILVYGSYARDEATPESDMDVLVVLKDPFNYWKEWKCISDIGYAVTFGRDRLLVASTLLSGEKEFLTSDSPLIFNIRREGKRAA